MLSRSVLVVIGLFAATAAAFQPLSSGARRPTDLRTASDSTAPAVANDFDAYQPGSTTELAVQDTVKGSGDIAETGDVVTVGFEAYTLDRDQRRSRFDKGTALTFQIGEGKILPGFEKALMVGPPVAEGTTRLAKVPSALAYGASGRRGAVPPNTDLLLEISVDKVHKGPIAGTLARFGANRAYALAAIFLVSIVGPMLGIGEKGFI